MATPDFCDALFEKPVIAVDPTAPSRTQKLDALAGIGTYLERYGDVLDPTELLLAQDAAPPRHEISDDAVDAFRKDVRTSSALGSNLYALCDSLRDVGADLIALAGKLGRSS